MKLLICWNVKNVLDLYLDRRLTPKAAARVAEHLEECENCAAEAEDLGGVSRFLKEDMDVAVPAGLAASILEKLGEQAEQSAPPARPTPVLTPAKVFAALYLMLIAGSHALPGEPTAGLGAKAALEREALQ